MPFLLILIEHDDFNDYATVEVHITWFRSEFFLCGLDFFCEETIVQNVECLTPREDTAVPVVHTTCFFMRMDLGLWFDTCDSTLTDRSRVQIHPRQLLAATVQLDD